MSLLSKLTVAELIASFDRLEIWREIDGWPYQVSSWGNVRRTGSACNLVLAKTGDYLHVDLSAGGEKKTHRVHRLVAESFLGPAPFEGAEVAHNDGDSLNCRVRNLRWASKVENQADRARHGTHLRGEAVFGSKLTDADIPPIRRRIASGERYQDIADAFGVDKSTIGLIAVNKIWRHVPLEGKAA